MYEKSHKYSFIIAYDFSVITTSLGLKQPPLLEAKEIFLEHIL